MGKEGSAAARRALYQAARTIASPRTPANHFRDYYQRRVTSGAKKKRALIATMGKMVEVMYHCLTRGEPYTYHAHTHPATAALQQEEP